MENSTPGITLQSVIRRKSAEHLISSEMGDELVMMDFHNGNYIGLNRVGKIIWELIEAPVRVEDLINTLLGRFNVSREVCVTDTLECLEGMLEQQVVEVGGWPSTGSG